MKRLLALLFLPLIALAQYNVPGSLVTPCCVTVANGGTGASSTTGAFSALAPSPTRAGDVIYWNGSNWVTLAGNNSGTQLLQETSSGVPSWVTGAAGTVSSFSAGNLSPLFTSSVATATSTPALTFSLTNAGATTLFGNLTGSSAAPSYTATSTIPLSDFGLGIGLTGYLYGNGSSAITASTTIPFSSLSGSATCAQLPALTGAVTTTAGTCATTAASIPTTALTGTLQAAQEPAHTGDMTNTAGSLVTTVGHVDGVAYPASPASTNTVPVVTSTGSGGSVTYEAVPNAALANASTTVSGQTCTLGSSCTIPASGIGSGAALTETNDTNVTLTLGGTPSTALLAATSETLGWTGTLAPSRGGLGAASLTGYLYGNGASAATASSTIPTTALSGTLQASQFPALTGAITTTAGSLATTAANIPVSALTAEGAYSILGNAMSGSAAPTALQSGIILGTPSFTDTGTGLQQTASVAGYFQNILQNTSNNAAASADFIVNNNLGTASTYYGDFGINSSAFSGTGSLSLPNATYLYSQTGDLVLGTNTSNTVRLLANNAATDALDILPANTVAIPACTGYAYGNAGSAISCSTTIPDSALVTAPVTNVTGTAPIVSSGGTTPAISINAATSSTAGSLAAADYAFLQAFENKTVVLATSNAYSSIKCDGATDDSAAWNTLFTNVPNNSLIVVPSCTTMLTSGTNPSIPSGKHLTIQGAGQSKTVFQSNNNSADFITVGDWYNTFVGMTFQGLNTTVTSNVALSATPVSLAVGNTANFPASGSFYVQTNLGWTLASYTSITNGTTFAGVTAATSTTVAGGPITVKTGGYAINGGSNAHLLVKDVQFNYVYNGFLNNATLGFVLDSSGFGVVNYDLQFNGANVNAVVHNYSTDGVPPAVAHLEVEQAGSLLISDCDLIRAQSNMRLNPTSPNGVFGVYVVNTYFDTATAVSGTASSGNGVLLQGTGNIQRLKIINSWMSSASHDGFWANSTAATLPTDIELNGNNIYSDTNAGVDLTAAQDAIIDGNQIAGNGTGIALTAATGAVTRAVIADNRIGPSGGIGANTTGINIAAGTYSNLNIFGNDISGNTTANIADSVTTVAVGNTAAHNISGNVGMPIAPNTCAPGQLFSATTITKVNCNSVFFPQNSVRIGSSVRITALVTCAATANTAPGFVPALRFGSADTSSDTAIVGTPAYSSAGTAAVGAAEYIWTFTILSATTAQGSLFVKNLNNAATGVLSTATPFYLSLAISTTALTIPNITTQNNFLGLYFTSTVANVDTVRSVTYEVIQ